MQVNTLGRMLQAGGRVGQQESSVPNRAGYLALLLAAIGLLGWVTGFDPLTSWVPGWTAQKVNTALAIGALAAALLAQPGQPAQSRTLAAVGAALGLFLASTAIFQRVTGLDLGVDQLLAADSVSEAAGQPPGRMAAGTAASLILVAGGLLLSKTAWVRTSQAFAAIAFGISWVAVLGYAYEVGPIPAEWLYGSVSLPTAVSVGTLAVGTAGLRPNEGYVRYLLADDPGAALLRRLGPPTLLLPGITAVGGNWLRRWLGVEAGFSAVSGATFNAVLFGALLATTAAAARRAHLVSRQLARQLIDVQEAERRSLAHELHDQLGQSLTALGLLIDRAARKPEARVQARELVTDLTRDIRSLALELRPSMLDDLGLVPALRWLVGRQVAFEASLHFEGEIPRFPPQIETAAFRIAQEALTNAARHSGATAATVNVAWTADLLTLTITDNGRGFSPTAARERTLGLSGMRDRAALLAGQLSIESDGRGTLVRVTLPARPEEGR